MSRQENPAKIRTEEKGSIVSEESKHARISIYTNIKTVWTRLHGQITILLQYFTTSWNLFFIYIFYK